MLAVTGTGASATGSVSLSYKQSVTSAHFKALGLEEVAKGSGYTKICWSIAAKAGSTHEWCATRAGQDAAWRLTGKRKGAKLRVDANSALLALDPQAAGLEPGLYKWNLAVTPCQSPPTSATGATAALPPADCAVKYPRTGAQTIRIRGLVPVGCKVKGASEISRGPRGTKKIALTFDDGPAPDTIKFLNRLKSLKVKATFFMIGQQVPGKGALLKRMMRDGHELANHSWNHANLASSGGVRQQLVSTNRAIKRASGFQPCVMRPPYGASNGNVVSTVRSLGMISILWDVDPLDWRLPGTGAIVNIIDARTRGGSVILEHDGGGPRGQTFAAIPSYVRTLKARGYEFVTVSELLGYKTKYKLSGD